MFPPEELTAYWSSHADPVGTCPRGDWILWWEIAEGEIRYDHVTVAILMLSVLSFGPRQAHIVEQLEAAAAGELFDGAVGWRGRHGYDPEDRVAEAALQGVAWLKAGNRYAAANHVAEALAAASVDGDAVRTVLFELRFPTPMAAGGARW